MAAHIKSIRDEKNSSMLETRPCTTITEVIVLEGKV